jgi:DNA-binding NarL/FixJ family response regulator
VTAVRRILDGDVWLPPHVSESSGALDHAEASAASRIAELTPQQFRVLGMIAAGLLNKQIAFELNVSEATIKAHMTAIMRKLQRIKSHAGRVVRESSGP